MDVLFKSRILLTRRFFSIILVGLLSFCGSIIIAEFRGIPSPFIHDEFSYILAADTYAHGRLTNPTHPMWEHFETFHVIQQPNYISKYPPAQGVFMAIGQVLWGHPIYGVWLSAALMCMAICWMLFAWVPGFWALVGGLVTVMQFGMFTYWSQSYWGGAVAALGGALVFGSLPRILRHQQVWDFIWLGCGIELLVMSRPFEGIVVAIPMGIFFLFWKMPRSFPNIPMILRKKLLSVSVLLLFIIASVGLYNKVTTGKAFTSPYLLYTKTYSYVPCFTWERLGQKPHYNNEMLSSFEEKSAQEYFEKKALTSFIERMKRDCKRLFIFFLGFPIASVMVFLIVWRRALAWRIGCFAGFVLLVCWAVVYRTKPHYFAPLTGLVILFIVEGFRVVSLFRFKRIRFGFFLVLFLIGIQLIFNITNQKKSSWFSVARIQDRKQLQEHLPELFTRDQLEKALIKQGGKHLVLVQYLPKHYFYYEWVYNNADIDHSPIVWARSLGAARDQQLLNYFKDRTVWHIMVLRDSHGSLVHDFR